MKKIILVSILFASLMSAVLATQHTVTNSGFAFSPATISINVGDTIVFSLASIHNARQVSKATWDANQSTALAGGFSTPMGGGTVAFPTEGIYYYVCVPHASLGMKGIILVGNVTGVSNVSDDSPFINVFPNPATSSINVSYTLGMESVVNIRLVNSAGVEVRNVLHESEIPGPYQQEIDLDRSLPRGIYFIVMNSDNQSYIQRVIVE